MFPCRQAHLAALLCIAAASAMAQPPGSAGRQQEQQGAARRAPAAEAARQQVHEAVQSVQEMKSDPQLARLLQRAQGVFIAGGVAFLLMNERAVQKFRSERNLTDIVADKEANRAYYGRNDAGPLTILSGRLDDPYGNALGRVLGA